MNNKTLIIEYRNELRKTADFEFLLGQVVPSFRRCVVFSWLFLRIFLTVATAFLVDTTNCSEILIVLSKFGVTFVVDQTILLHNPVLK